MTTLARYADWKAPDQDEAMLLWPRSSALMEQSRRNAALLSAAQSPIQGLPLHELRTAQRRFVGHALDEAPLLATGHQTELAHPGVWAKDVVIDGLARRLSGRAVHFAVDTDAPKHLHLRWPGHSAAITDDEMMNRAAWSALLAGPTPARVNELESALLRAAEAWGFAPSTAPFFQALRARAMHESNLPMALVAATQAVNQTLGLSHDMMPTSPLWQCEPYALFLHHALARADELAARYNAALEAYRRQEQIRDPGRPMPDLAVEEDRIEAPFWLDDLTTGARRRLWLTRKGDRWASPELDLELDPRAPAEQAAGRMLSALRSSGRRVAPRALMLTLYFRIMLADQFVHGIGGGRYDQVTDRIIESWLGIEAPAFSVATSTLYFPAAHGQKRISLRPLLQEGRRLRHGAFWRDKRDLARRIAQLPRGSAARRDLFLDLHARLDQIAASDAMRRWSAQLEEATREQLRQKAVFDRELFFAIQPAGRLLEMIRRYHQAMGL